MVVDDLVASALEHPNADRGRIHQPEIVNVIVGHNVFVILFIVIRKLLRFAEFDAAPTEVEQLRGQQLAPLRSPAKKIA